MRAASDRRTLLKWLGATTALVAAPGIGHAIAYPATPTKKPNTSAPNAKGLEPQKLDELKHLWEDWNCQMAPNRVDGYSEDVTKAYIDRY